MSLVSLLSLMSFAFPEPGSSTLPSSVGPASGGLYRYGLGSVQVVRPAQFVTQCVTLWECLVEQPHVAELGGVEPFPILRRQTVGQLWKQPRSIRGAVRPGLFELHDVASHLPAGPHLHRVHSTQGLLPGLLDQSAQLPDQSVESRRSRQSRGLFTDLLLHKLLPLSRKAMLVYRRVAQSG